MFGKEREHGYFARNNPYRGHGRQNRGPPRPPGSGSGPGRHVSSWKQQLFGLVGALAVVGTWYSTPFSTWVTSVALDTIPIEEDIKLGIEAEKQFQYPAVYDQHWSPIVDSVGKELIRAYNQQQQRERGLGVRYLWDFAIIDADAINAFALPGGAVRVTLKLLKTLQLSRGELAALLGHEVGHVVHRHSQARMLQHQLLQRIIQALVYDNHDGTTQESFGQALGELLTKSASWLGQQKFSRRDEYEADATSWDLLLLTDGYNPQSLHSLLSKLQSLEGRRHRSQPKSVDDSFTQKVIEWSQTHPATKDRLIVLWQKWDNIPAIEKRRLSAIPV